MSLDLISEIYLLVLLAYCRQITTENKLSLSGMESGDVTCNFPFCVLLSQRPRKVRFPDEFLSSTTDMVLTLMQNVIKLEKFPKATLVCTGAITALSEYARLLWLVVLYLQGEGVGPESQNIYLGGCTSKYRISHYGVQPVLAYRCMSVMI